MIDLQEEANNDKMETLEFNTMNTTFFISISNSSIADWKSPIISWLKYMEYAFSRFQNNNELCRFNETKRDSLIYVSPTLYDLLKKAEEYRIKTEGRFSPYMLTQLEEYGYKQSFPFETSTNEEKSTNYEKEFQPLLFHEGSQITKKTSQRIDLGGIAKGYAVEAVSKWLKKHAHSRYGIVDGGGDIAVWSNGEKTWNIGVMHPYHEDQEVGHFCIQNGGIATSNIIYRSWRMGDTKKHHILDGRTGMPVYSPIVQASVVTEHCLDAEIGAKICLMDDPTCTKSVLKKVHEQFSYVLVTFNGDLKLGGTV
ncbi:FAD:protein FMN transferase [Brevibacillus daliensis]|uniref:FAD:protein FMN transferase n=1 Tax=Brevibacillus daliensis TaxID=2892995 RepID=UPI001E3E0CF2|nr:FAD:protein FMN transferase [Brevibacillus daliensis]